MNFIGVCHLVLCCLIFYSDVDKVVRLSQTMKDFSEAGGMVCDGENLKLGEDDGGKCGMKRQFKSPEKDLVIDEFSRKKFAKNSNNNINWAVNLFCQWRKNRLSKFCSDVEIVHCHLDCLNQFSKADMCHSLARFIREVKRLDGKDYPPNTLRELIIMIQMYLHKNGIFWRLLDNPEFVVLHNVLDNTMKERHSMGLGVRQPSKIISLNHEATMFEKEILGEESPEQLLNTVIYMIGMHCALRGGMEHNKLRCPGCGSQLTFQCDNRGMEQLVYREDPLQKTNQGGLECNGTRKVVYVYGAEDQRRCPLQILKKYIGLLPETKQCKKLYLQAKERASPKVCFCDQPYGNNKIKVTIREMCKNAGLVGKFTNHSLRATCASHMYGNDGLEQLIKEVTGHRSECVRTYKRTSDQLRQKCK